MNKKIKFPETEQMSLCQDMDKVVVGLNRQLAELSESIYNKRKSLELMRKDRMETKELLRDKLEVHPVVL